MTILFSGRKVFDYYDLKYRPSDTFLPRLEAKSFAKEQEAKGLQVEVLNYGAFSAVVLDDVGLPHYSVHQREKKHDVADIFLGAASESLDFYVKRMATPEELKMSKELAKSPLRKKTEQFLARLFRRESQPKSPQEEKSLD